MGVDGPARFEHAFDAAGLGFGLLDPEGRYCEANSALLTLFGRSRDEVVGSPLAGFGDDPDEVEEIRVLHARLLAGAIASYSRELALRDGAGSIVWARATVTPLPPAEGEAGPSAVVILEDVTERRSMEVELQRSNADLARFAAVASHDLSEPLRMVSAYVQLLARRYEGQLDEQADQFIAFAVDGTARMRQLIDDLLRYAEAGSSTVEARPVDLGAVVADVAGELDGEADITVGPLPTVLGRAGELRQVFRNLLGNAIKFQPEQQRASIAVAAQDAGSSWRVSVADDGIGIPAEQRERVFGMFQRLHSRAEYGGTGIGLALCRRILEAHGGSIRIDDRESGDGGTVVLLSFPKAVT